MKTNQRQLAKEQIEEFYVDLFADDQVTNFASLTESRLDKRKRIVDVGGGCGYFAKLLHDRLGLSSRVIDMDSQSVEICRGLNGDAVDAQLGDALAPPIVGDEGTACFNLILHHLVASTEQETLALQRKAIEVWRGRIDFVFVNEYVYDSIAGDFSGWVIYAITSSKILSTLASKVAKFIPSLRANTFGVGVRFRSDASWRRTFRESGYQVVGYVRGREELTTPRRVLFLKSIRRDAYLLAAS